MRSFQRLCSSASMASRRELLKAAGVLAGTVAMPSAFVRSSSAAAMHASAGFQQLQVDAGKVIGKLRDMQGVNGPPAPIMADLPNLTHQYRELRPNQIRTHDCMGPTDIDSKFEFKNPYLAALIPDPTQRAGVVEAGNKSIIFPDWNADPEKAESYNFGPTERILASIGGCGAEVYYRIGRSWGANNNPPPDFDKYAAVVKHVAMHFNHGWADGYHHNIRYWEFWNEPDGLFWSGTPAEFYSLYKKTALALKSLDSTLCVGGVGLANPAQSGPYLEGFIDYCAKHHLPLDFFSWHTYTPDPYAGGQHARTIRRILDARGFSKARSILSEWNLSADFSKKESTVLQSNRNAAYVGAAVNCFQDAPIDQTHFYRGDAAWMGLFDLHARPFKPAFTFFAMDQMLTTPRRLAVEGGGTHGFTAMAGRSQDDMTVHILISNYVMPAQGRSVAGYHLLVNHLPWNRHSFSMKRYRLDHSRNLELVEAATLSGGSFKLSSSFTADALDLIVLKRR